MYWKSDWNSHWEHYEQDQDQYLDQEIDLYNVTLSVTNETKICMNKALLSLILQVVIKMWMYVCVIVYTQTLNWVRKVIQYLMDILTFLL